MRSQQTKTKAKTLGRYYKSQNHRREKEALRECTEQCQPKASKKSIQLTRDNGNYPGTVAAEKAKKTKNQQPLQRKTRGKVSRKNPAPAPKCNLHRKRDSDLTCRPPFVPTRYYIQTTSPKPHLCLVTDKIRSESGSTFRHKQTEIIKPVE